MKSVYSVEIDNSNPTSVAHCLNLLERNISDFYEWKIVINSGPIDYGIFFNIRVGEKEIEINNSPSDGKGEDMLEDVFREEEE